MFEIFQIKKFYFGLEIPGFFEATKPIGCDEGWTKISGKCYKVSIEKTSWFKATEKCVSLGGKLVEPMSAKEQDAVAALAKVSLGMQNYWIGLTDKEIEDKYRFSKLTYYISNHFLLGLCMVAAGKRLRIPTGGTTNPTIGILGVLRIVSRFGQNLMILGMIKNVPIQTIMSVKMVKLKLHSFFKLCKSKTILFYRNP